MSRPDEGADRAALAATGDSIRAAFARADDAAATAYHHPGVVKAFGIGDSALDGRDAMRANLAATLRRVRLEFVENRVESFRLRGDMAVEVTTPTAGGRHSTC